MTVQLLSAEMLLWRMRNEGLINANERKELAETLKQVGVVSLARALGYNWRNRAQPLSRVQELALKAYARGMVGLGIVAELFDHSKEEMHDLLAAWGVAQEFSDKDLLLGTVK